MINKLINRKSYARTSSKPGKTQTLNFYRVENELYFVDVPGYGYAKVSKKQREKFGQIIEAYLTNRDNLRGLISLIDGRHEPTDDDIAMYVFAKYYDIPVLVVATKMDKISTGKWNRQERSLKRHFDFNPVDKFVCFSALTGAGKDTVWEWIEQQCDIGGRR